MVRVYVRVQRVDQLEPELLDEGRIPVDLIEHWIDDHRLARFLVGNQVRVCRRRGVVELAHTMVRRLGDPWSPLGTGQAT